MIYSWRKIILWTLSFRRRKETHKKFASVKITKLENFYIRSERKLEFINADYLARARLGSIFRHERGRIQEKKKKQTGITLYLFFHITVTPYERTVQHAEMHTHAESSDTLSSRSIVKPRISLRYVGCAPYSVSEHRDTWKERGETREEALSASSLATKFSCSQCIFLFGLYNPTLLQSRMFRGDYLSEYVFPAGE